MSGRQWTDEERLVRSLERRNWCGPTKAGRIYDLMQGDAQFGGMTAHDVAGEIGSDSSSVSAIMCQMERRGTIVCVGRRRPHWRNKGPGRQREKIYVRSDEANQYRKAPR